MPLQLLFNGRFLRSRRQESSRATPITPIRRFLTGVGVRSYFDFLGDAAGIPEVRALACIQQRIFTEQLIRSAAEDVVEALKIYCPVDTGAARDSITWIRGLLNLGEGVTDAPAIGRSAPSRTRGFARPIRSTRTPFTLASTILLPCDLGVVSFGMTVPYARYITGASHNYWWYNTIQREGTLMQHRVRLSYRECC